MLLIFSSCIHASNATLDIEDLNTPFLDGFSAGLHYKEIPATAKISDNQRHAVHTGYNIAHSIRCKLTGPWNRYYSVADACPNYKKALEHWENTTVQNKILYILIQLAPKKYQEDFDLSIDQVKDFLVNPEKNRKLCPLKTIEFEADALKDFLARFEKTTTITFGVRF